MMKRLTGLVFIMVVAAFIVIGCSNVNEPAGDNNLEYGSMSALANGGDVPSNSASVDLIAGRTEDVGEVNCWIKGDNLFVLYSMDTGWKLAETQLVVAGSIFDIELTRKGNPKVGHFPWKTEHESPVAEYLYSIALDELGFEYTGEMVIAAHAAVLLYSEEGAVERDEGAWAYGERFIGAEIQDADRIEKPDYSKDDGGSDVVEKESVDSGNWSMYFTVTGWQITVRELLINEIFYAGSDRSNYYFYDQFVELYNTSEETLYLDGCIITRNYPPFSPISRISIMRGRSTHSSSPARRLRGANTRYIPGSMSWWRLTRSITRYGPTRSISPAPTGSSSIHLVAIGIIRMSLMS